MDRRRSPWRCSTSAVATAQSLPAYREFEPSGEFDYTNEGFNLAGVVIERTAGMPYAAFLQRFVFEPAGMLDTGSDLTSTTERPVARGLTFEAAGSQDGERAPNEGSPPAMDSVRQGNGELS